MNAEHLSFYFSVPIQIRMSDLDPFAHVNNGIQAHYFDYGRSAYLENITNEQIDWLTLQFVLVHLEMDFLNPIMFHHHVSCETKVYEIGNKSFKMVQRLIDTHTQEIKTVAKSVLVGFDRKTNRAIEISEKYRKLFLQFENR